MVRMPLPSSPTRQANASVNSTSLDALDRLPELVLEALQTQRIDRAVGPETRHEKTRQSARRLCQHQESVAHRRGKEPLAADDG